MVDWDLARGWRPAPSILKPPPGTYRSADLQAQFDELTARAELLVSEATGLHSAHGLARAKVTDGRSGPPPTSAPWSAWSVRRLANIQEKRVGQEGGQARPWRPVGS